MPNLVKVGKTTNDPSMRVDQLSATTGVPERFELFKAYAVADCSFAEKLAHHVLEMTLGRPNNHREFFCGSPQEIVSILDDVLHPHIVQSDICSITTFREPFNRLRQKEFTFACLEFEALFRALPLTELRIQESRTLKTAVGGYVASCVGIDRPPYSPVVLATKSKSDVMTQAIEFAREFISDPVSEVLDYVRLHE